MVRLLLQEVSGKKNSQPAVGKAKTGKKFQQDKEAGDAQQAKQLEEMGRRFKEVEDRLSLYCKKVTVLEAKVRTLEVENENLRAKKGTDREASEDSRIIMDEKSNQNINSVSKPGPCLPKTNEKGAMETHKPTSYLEVARRASTVQELGLHDQEKVNMFHEKMGALMPKAGATPKVTAVHFRNLPKTERKYIEDAVRELLAKRKLLHVSFIGNSVMEILIEEEDSPAIISLVTSAGMIRMPDFNVFENSTRRHRQESETSARAANMSKLRGRARYCASTADNYAAKEWYWSLARAAGRRLRDLSRDSALSAPRRNLLAPRLTNTDLKLKDHSGSDSVSSSNSGAQDGNGTPEAPQVPTNKLPRDNGSEDEKSIPEENCDSDEISMDGIKTGKKREVGNEKPEVPSAELQETKTSDNAI